MADKSKILIIRGTGYIGKYLVEASAEEGHPTYVLIRESTASAPEKLKLIETSRAQGEIHDHGSLVAAIKRVDVVISALGWQQRLADQVKIITAIKEAGNIKRFLPSEFGSKLDSSTAVEPLASGLRLKDKIRRTIEAEGVPHTYIVSNAFLGYCLPKLGLVGDKVAPRDEVTILGDGNQKAIFVKEEDIATYTIKAVDDPRTLNKFLFMRPPANVLNYNEIVSLWEKKTGKTLEKTYFLEDEVLKKIRESLFPINLMWAIGYSIFVKGSELNSEIDASIQVEASQLYPEVRYKTVDEYLSLLAEH